MNKQEHNDTWMDNLDLNKPEIKIKELKNNIGKDKNRSYFQCFIVMRCNTEYGNETFNH